MTTFTDKDLAKLIKKCAFEWVNATTSDIRQELSVPFIGKRVCIETARGMGIESFGQLIYLMLAHSWNDTLDWADKIAEREGGMLTITDG